MCSSRRLKDLEPRTRETLRDFRFPPPREAQKVRKIALQMPKIASAMTISRLQGCSMYQKSPLDCPEWMPKEYGESSQDVKSTTLN